VATALVVILLAGVAPVATADAVDAFLERHWSRPLPAQGVPPTGWTGLEASLAPEDCGQCHADQYAQWQTSFHARAMGPGLLGQLRDYAADDRAGHQDCLRCHAPLAEQADALVAELQGEDPGGMGLHRQGLICAACHVRQRTHYGPPRRDGSVPEPGVVLPHAGWTPTDAFGDARFCGACHQFDDDGYALEGKLLENTLAEWQASRYAREGVSCQQCHMPDRRHLWRGIHDPEMTRSGVTVETLATTVDGGNLSGGLVVRNSGTGHHFPTYLTPRIVFEGVQVDAAGSELPDTRVEWWIARAVTLDLSAELFDSRIPVDEARELVYALPRAAAAVALQMTLRVEPDAFYTDFYRALLANGSGPGRVEIEQALQDSLASHYTLFETRMALPD
jgi:hypothetical protein